MNNTLAVPVNDELADLAVGIMMRSKEVLADGRGYLLLGHPRKALECSLEALGLELEARDLAREAGV